jgi:hypothetical protein
METSCKQKTFYTSSNKNNNNKNNNNTGYNNKPTPIKIYFPNISLNKINEIINPDKKIKNRSVNSTINNISSISKYLVDEKSKTIIYGSTGIFEMLNNNLYQLYPIDRSVKEITINNNINLLLDGSYMKRSDTSSYQIPYYYTIKYKTIKTYKNDNKSNIKFIIEMENDKLYDFYVSITTAETNTNEKNEIEINKFVKDEIVSFLSRLNLYR